MRNAILILCALGLSACGSKTYFLNLTQANITAGGTNIASCQCEAVDAEKVAADEHFSAAPEDKPHYAVPVFQGEVQNFGNEGDWYKWCQDGEVPEDKCAPGPTGGGAAAPAGGTAQNQAGASGTGGTPSSGGGATVASQSPNAMYQFLVGYPVGTAISEDCKTHFGIASVGSFQVGTSKTPCELQKYCLDTIKQKKCKKAKGAPADFSGNDKCKFKLRKIQYICP